MASITIRNLSNPIKERLHIKAAKNGVSLETYARSSVLQQDSNMNSEKEIDILKLACKYFGTDNSIDLELPKRGSSRESVNFYPWSSSIPMLSPN